ncbi:MAG TPA: hypothetical protein VF035_06525 [Longimicrobiales bacterium]
MRSASLTWLFAALLLPGCRDKGGGGRDAVAAASVQALAEELRPSLERLSGLRATKPFTIRTQDATAIRAYVVQRLAEEMPPEELSGLHDTYALLGLIPDTLDLHSLLLDLYAEQVVGYYDPGTRTMYVLEGTSPSALRPVLAHELVHALQDQHTNVDSLISSGRGSDRQAAAHAALEGHATIVMFALLAEDAEKRELNPAALPNPAAQLRQGLEAPDPEFPVFGRAPAIVRETLMFPYVGGADFVHSVWSQDSAGHVAPIGNALPQSTEQILHPVAKFVRERDAPTELRFDAVPPEGWRIRREDTFGELETAILLGHHLGAAARAKANGWDGDRYRLLENDRNERVFVWHTIWDDAASADAFAAAMRQIASARTGRTMRVELIDIGGRPGVRVVDAGTSSAGMERMTVRIEQGK